MILHTKEISRPSDLVSWRLCLGCGACAWICPKQNVRLFDFVTEGIRPVVENPLCETCQDRQCLKVCPATETDYGASAGDGPKYGRGGFQKEWGPVVQIWEGYATDPIIRFKGASGGVITALGAFAVEVLGMEGVLHLGQDPDCPVRNSTRLSRTRDDLLAATGSRYSPGSVCTGLGLIEAARAPCVIVGRPAEIAAVRKAEKLKPRLKEKVGLTVSFFCAEAPSTAGTLALIARFGVDPKEVVDVRYRGNGWPGHFAVTCGYGTPQVKVKMTYSESWRFLQAYRPWSAHLWPDCTGELADISCGDPWYTEPNGHNPGFSLVIARTERGQRVLEGATLAGYLVMEPAETWKLVKSQAALFKKKGATWGRRLALRLLGLPVTSFTGLDLFHCWRQLSGQERTKSIAGTLRRVLKRGLYHPLQLEGTRAVPVKECGRMYASPIHCT